jgi:hypothetical protein
MGEPITNNPPVNGEQAAINAYYFKKHSPATLKVINSLDDKVKDMYNDEDAFASFVFYCLSMMIKKGTWRVGRNKKIGFTPLYSL